LTQAIVSIISQSLGFYYVQNKCREHQFRKKYSAFYLNYYDVKIYVRKHLTQAICSGFSLSFQCTYFIYKTSLLKIFSGFYLSRYDMNIFVKKQLRRTLISGLPLSPLSPSPYDVRNSWTELQYSNTFGSFSHTLWRKIYVNKHLTEIIYSGLSLSLTPS